MTLLSPIVRAVQGHLQPQSQQQFFTYFTLFLAVIASASTALSSTFAVVITVNTLATGLWVLLMLGMRLGLSTRAVCHCCTGIGTVLLIAEAWYSGGIFASGLAWMGVLLIANYFILGQRAALLTLVLCVGAHVAIVLPAPWLDQSPVQQAISQAQNAAFLIDNTLVFLVISLVFLFYHRADVEILLDLQKRQIALEQQRAQLEHTMAARDQFIAAINHEVKQPLAMMAEISESLLAADPYPPDICMVLEHTSHCAMQIRATVTDLLDYTRLQSGQLQTRLQALQLQVELHTAYAALQTRRKSPALRCTLEIDTGLRVPLVSDKALLALILDKLIENACRYTSSGLITISAQRSGDDAVLIAVQDSGIGMSESEQQQLRDRLAAGSALHEDPRRGSGLGLLIAQGLARLLGGAMGFESTPYQGSRFWVRLPLQGPAASPGHTA